MTRVERLLLLAFFGFVVVLLAYARPVPALGGGVAGAVVGVLLAGRLRRLSARMDDRLGSDAVHVGGVRLRSLGLRAGAHLALLVVLLFGIAFVPFIGDDLFIGVAAGATTLPAVLTAWRLRR